MRPEDVRLQLSSQFSPPGERRPRNPSFVAFKDSGSKPRAGHSCPRQQPGWVPVQRRGAQLVGTSSFQVLPTSSPLTQLAAADSSCSQPSSPAPGPGVGRAVTQVELRGHHTRPAFHTHPVTASSGPGPAPLRSVLPPLARLWATTPARLVGTRVVPLHQVSFSQEHPSFLQPST